jgi:hypothetical protein
MWQAQRGSRGEAEDVGAGRGGRPDCLSRHRRRGRHVRSPATGPGRAAFAGEHRAGGDEAALGDGLPAWDPDLSGAIGRLAVLRDQPGPREIHAAAHGPPPSAGGGSSGKTRSRRGLMRARTTASSWPAAWICPRLGGIGGRDPASGGAAADHGRADPCAAHAARRCTGESPGVCGPQARRGDEGERSTRTHCGVEPGARCSRRTRRSCRGCGIDRTFC